MLKNSSTSAKHHFMNYILFGENNLHRLKNTMTDASVAFLLPLGVTLHHLVNLLR